jgi:hypothetical protein
VDSANTRNTIAQRGKSKQHRADLRLVGLGLIVSTDGGVPLVSHPYPGNRPDVTQFVALVGELLGRWGELAADGADLTVVYDAGQDSTANQALISGSPLHFVGSLPPSDHPELLAVPTRRYRPVDPDAFGGLTAYDTQVAALGGTWRAVCTHSVELHAKQARGLEQTLAKAQRRLDELGARLARGKTRRQRPAVQAEVARICADRWVTRVLATTLEGERPAALRLRWHLDIQARRALEEELFGKRILFTDRTDWSVAQVVAAYRSQEQVEADFRQMKDPKVVSFQPVHHWTDQKVVVHAFYCTLLHAGVGRGPAVAPRGSPGRTCHERARTAGPPGRHPRDRPALSGLSGPAGPSPRPAHAHPGRPHPNPPVRAIRPRRLRPTNRRLGHTPSVPIHYRSPAETPPPHELARKLPLVRSVGAGGGPHKDPPDRQVGSRFALPERVMVSSMTR